MSDGLSESELLFIARRKVQRIKSLYLNFLLFLAVNALIVVNHFLPANVSNNNYYWLIVLWGGYLLYHCCTLFESFWIFSSRWEEKKTQKELEKLRKREAAHYL